ncbi:MAG: ADP-ribosylglycohydrolase family protein [Actinobacteria bacterium]|nr:ADP-ribosylglycohydrolase family protein [Actinomycetota bacterium]
MGDGKSSGLARFQGSLLGLAIGDALGMPLEGMRASAIRDRFGGVHEFMDAPWRLLKAGQWTDDTKMMLCHARSIARMGGFDLMDTAAEFVAWYESNDWRGLGRATYDALRRLQAGCSPAQSGMQGELAAGNGGAMRIAPVGLIDCRDLDRLREDTRAAVAITHDNQEAIAGSQAVAYMVARAVRGDLDLDLIVSDTVTYIGPCKTAERLQLASRFLAKEMALEEALARLGTSGYVVETVASAMFCFLYSPHDFEQTVSHAVEGGLDADTTGAVAGAISGAYNGLDSIPERWRENVEAADEILDLAGRIFTLAADGSG